jgi:acetolactate synthase-1/2/3 large subunit
MYPEDSPAMSKRPTLGDVIHAFLVNCGVDTAFGVISIHNMPILDAFFRGDAVRFVPARGEAGAVNMADSFARVSGRLGVAVTSTGTGAGNACGALVEAMTAGTPLLHLTGQVESPYVDLNCGYIHEAPRQLEMLAAVSKKAFSIRSADSAMEILREAVLTAMTAPTGPVSIEIPVDIQATKLDWPEDLQPTEVPVLRASQQEIEALADALVQAHRPMLWLGGGARHAADAALQLAELGFGVISSVNGRGIVPEVHPGTLGAFTYHPETEKLYDTCDAMLMVGSRLRSNEALSYKLRLPQPLFRVDAIEHHATYRPDLYLLGDSRDTLQRLVAALGSRLRIDPKFAADIASARKRILAGERESLGQFTELVDSLDTAAGDDFVWVRDVTLGNSIWGNRMLHLSSPRDGVHALGGGIGQGLPMAIGAALAAGDRAVYCLAGDGGLMLNPGEFATAVQEKANFILLLMNDRGYGVIKNIQTARYGARYCYVDLHTPDFESYCASLSVPYLRVEDLKQTASALARAKQLTGPVVVEFVLEKIGYYSNAFAGPVVRQEPQPC